MRARRASWGACAPEGEKESRRRPTLARAGPALPSAKRRLTSVFGMGTGIAAWDGNGYCRLSVATGEKGRGCTETSGSIWAATWRRGPPLLDEVGKTS